MNKVIDTLRATEVDARVVDRLARVYDIADRAHERGVMSWAERAATDAAQLNRLRTRDYDTLDRIEDTFDDEYYRQFRGANLANPVYA